MTHEETASQSCLSIDNELNKWLHKIVCLSSSSVIVVTDASNLGNVFKRNDTRS